MKINRISLLTPVLLYPSILMSQDIVNNAVEKNVLANQMVIEKSNDVKYYNTDDLKKVTIDNETGKVTIITNSNAEDSYIASISNISFAKAITNVSVKITEANGWLESAYAEWELEEDADSYNVYIKGGQYSDYTKIDAELVRTYSDHGRADAVGLKAGTYSMKVAPVKDGIEGEASEVSNLTVKNYKREGFAFFNYTSGVGAYNDDGTLKNGAEVIYVTKDNAKTVTANLSSGTFTGIQAILSAFEKGNVTTPLAIRIIGLISSGDVDSFGNSSEGLQIKGKKAYSTLNITIEGIGEDAAIKGFGFLARNATSLEIRNLGILRQMDDGISLDTENSHIWIHNLDLFYGKNGGGDKAKGDGSIDLKDDTQYVTINDNHFWDSGKCSMAGMKSESGPNYISYHHNWFDHSDSRHARVRTMSVHMWNNYFDGNAKYGVGATTGSSVFMENNYFRHTKDPYLISLQGTDAKGSGTFSGENGGMIKTYGDIIAEKGSSSNYTPITYTNNNTSFDCYVASSRDEVVPSTIVTLAGGTSYNNFDTNSSLMYSYTPDAAEDVPGIVTGYFGAGRMNHGDLQYQFTNSTDDESYDVISALANMLDAYSGSGLSGNSNTEETTDDNSNENSQGDNNQNTGSETISESILCTFNKSGVPSNSMFTVTGNGSNSKGSVTIDGVTYTECLKMETSTSIKFTTTADMTINLYFSTTSGAQNIIIDGTKVTGTNYIYTGNLAAGNHELKKADSANLFGIKLEKK